MCWETNTGDGKMTRIILMVTCACAAAFGVSTHALGNDVHSVGAQYAHVTGEIGQIHSELSQDASAVQTGLTALHNAQADFGSAAHGGQASSH
jgi:hypothetical protein